MGASAGPNAEFFHVIAHRRHAAGMHGCSVAQIGDYVLDFAERDEIAERLLAGEKPDALPAVLGDVRAKEFLGLKASGEKMDIVDQCVVNGGCG